MHYSNGRKAQLGDVARGKGYNIKHEIIGMVVNLRDSEHCNLSVACVTGTSAASLPVIFNYRDAPKDKLPYIGTLDQPFGSGAV